MWSHRYGDRGYICYYFELDKFALTITPADDQDEKIVKVHMPGEMKTFFHKI